MHLPHLCYVWVSLNNYKLTVLLLVSSCCIYRCIGERALTGYLEIALLCSAVSGVASFCYFQINMGDD